eukprot:TRINITY_DN15548_c0_g1_i1.p1 TRINITY_DN15548_c0_g1~~TRINITY_DN15548_c0_g1_i1.p1  ORF type:complete len:972 (-),score=339.69 TRINITY_DN15548_c0_g1_i1:44-2935(-)
MEEEIQGYFSECQEKTALHRKCIGKMKALQAKDPKQFFFSFVDCVDCILPYHKRETAVENVVVLIKNFCSFSNETYPLDDVFVSLLLAHLLEVIDVDDKGVRFRATQLIGEVINSMPEEFEFSEELWQALEPKLIARASDKAPAVRQAAAVALSRLQDPTNMTEGSVLYIYLHMLENDPAREVRRTVLTFMSASIKTTVAKMLSRSRDVSEIVRKMLYNTLQQKVPMRALITQQRVDLLADGLHDRSDIVRRNCTVMLQSWLEQCDSNPVKLLQALASTQNQDIAALALLRLLQADRTLSCADIDLNNLTAEQALYVRVYCQFLKQEKRDDELEELLTDLSTHCQVLQQTANKKSPFITQQLLRIACLMDMSDEAGRQRLVGCLNNMLEEGEVDLDCMKITVQLMRALFTNETEFNTAIAGIISAIVAPLEEEESDEARAQRVAAEKALLPLVAQIQELEAKKAALVGLEQFEAAALVKHEIEAGNKRVHELEKLCGGGKFADSNAWLRAVVIAGELLANSHKTLRDPALHGLLEHVIVPAMRQCENDQEVMTHALRCMGLYCLLDLEAAQKHLQMFINALEIGEGSVQPAVMKVLFDFIMLFGPDLADDDTLNVLIVGLSQFLREAGDKELRDIAVEGFAKLFTSDRVNNPKVFALLVLLFFSPATEDDHYLRQCLSVFFVGFAAMSPEHRDIVETAFEPTLTKLLKAPANTPLGEVEVTAVVKYFIYLTDPAMLANGSVGESLHGRIGLTIAREIIAGGAGEMRALCRLLSYLNIAKDDQISIKALCALGDDITTAVDKARDSVAKKLAVAFVESVAALDATPEAPLEEELLGTVRKTTETVVAQRAAVNASTRKTPRKPKRKLGARTAVPFNVDGEDAEEDEEAAEAETTALVAASAATTAVAKATKAKKATTARTRKPKAAAVDKENAEDENAEDAEPTVVEKVKPAARASRAKRTAKA